MNLHIISFGSDYRYVKLSKKVTSNLFKAYPEAKIKIFRAEDLPAFLNEYAGKERRGYGYWIWKPYLIFEYMKSMEEGDVLLYVDGRCGASGQKIPWLDRFINEKKHDIAAWELNYPEYKYTSQDVFRIFSLNKSNADIFYSNQFAATFFSLRVNVRTIEFFEEWFLVVNNNRVACSDVLIMFNESGFIENRHDQSVFSILLKLRKVKVMIFNELDLGPWLLAHKNDHPATFYRMIIIILKKKMVRYTRKIRKLCLWF